MKIKKEAAKTEQGGRNRERPRERPMGERGERGEGEGEEGQ